MLKKEKRNARMRAYFKKRYHTRRNQALKHLGGICCGCGTDKDLEIDHIDPSSKAVRDFSEIRTMTEENFWLEINKCQLLCGGCHDKKTTLERGHNLATHGSLVMYARYKCRCESCKTAWRKYHRERTQKKTGKLVKPRPDNFAHGTSNGYSYHGCRCSLCQDFQRIRMREYYRNKKIISAP